MPNDMLHTATTRELYRTPAPDLSPDVFKLDMVDRGEMDAAQQQAWASDQITATVERFREKAEHASRNAPALVATSDATACRADLSAAIQDWAIAREAARVAGAAYARAQNLVAMADGRLADFVGLADKITAWRANAIRDGRDDEPLPHDLARMQAEAGTAADRCAELRRAMMALQADSIAANATLAAADHQRATLAAQVILGEMDRLAAAIAAIDARAQALREALYSAAACHLIVPGASPIIAASRQAATVLSREPSPLSVDHEFNRNLKAWHAALMLDSTATLADVTDAAAPAAA